MNAVPPDPRKRARLARPDDGSASDRQARERVWLDENREAIENWNDWVARNGLPLGGYRQF